MTVTLKKTRAAYDNQAAIYATEDGRYRVMCFKNQTWSASRGSYTHTQWTATDTQQRGTDGALVDVATATSLESLKRRLGRYLEDLGAGCVRAPFHYRQG